MGTFPYIWCGLATYTNYGIGISSVTMKELSSGLGSADFYLLNKLDAVGSVKNNCDTRRHNSAR